MSDEHSAVAALVQDWVLDPDTIPVAPDDPDPLADVERRLRDDLARVRERLVEKRQAKADLFQELRLLVAAEDVLTSALRPFDRRHK